MTDKVKPMLIFTTCKECGACKSFRGPDGKPRDNQPWSASFIRDKLTSNGKLKALRIINIHDGEFGPNVNHIKEFTIYHMIPPTIRITKDFVEKLLDNPEPYYGTSILRIKLEKNTNGSIEISVEIDGNPDDHRCPEIVKQIDNYFLWNFIPEVFYKLKLHFNGILTDNIETIISELEDDPFYNVILKDYYEYQKNPILYEQQVRIRFGFSWFISIFYPERFRDLEAFYPSWTLILPSEWNRGLLEQEAMRENGSSLTPIYAKVVSCKTTLDGTKFKSQKIANENINDCLTQYYAGRLSLTYQEELLNRTNSKYTIN